VIGSHRYLPCVRTGWVPASPTRPLRVLILGGLWFELPMLATLMEQCHELLAGFEVVIRPYSYAWSHEQQQAIASLRRIAPHLRVETGSLREQLRGCDVALFSSTSAGIQAMLSGCLAIYVALHDLFEADPLWGSHAIFARCTSGPELRVALERARHVTTIAAETIRQQQRTYAESIFAPINEEQLYHQLVGHALSAHPMDGTVTQEHADVHASS